MINSANQLNNSLKKLRFVPNKIRREMRRLPILSSQSERNYFSALEEYKKKLPILSPDDVDLVKTMNQEGFVISHVEELQLSSTPQMIEAAKKLVNDFVGMPSKETLEISPYVPTLPHFQLVEHYPEIFLWGLEERLIDIIETYIGLPLRYQGAEFRKGIANGKVVDVRQWHIDTEDHRMLKIIFYLNDVSVSGGPFECLSKSSTLLATQALNYRSGFVADQTMDRVVPFSDWKTCTGEAYTVVFADTCNIFHRAKAPTKLDRYSITFSYTSRSPIEYRSKLTFSTEQWSRLSAQLSERQIALIQ